MLIPGLINQIPTDMPHTGLINQTPTIPYTLFLLPPLVFCILYLVSCNLDFSPDQDHFFGLHKLVGLQSIEIHSAGQAGSFKLD